MWYDFLSLLYYKFTAECVLEEFLKSLDIWQSYGKNLIALSALGHRPAEI